MHTQSHLLTLTHVAEVGGREAQEGRLFAPGHTTQLGQAWNDIPR